MCWGSCCVLLVSLMVFSGKWSQRLECQLLFGIPLENTSKEVKKQNWRKQREKLNCNRVATGTNTHPEGSLGPGCPFRWSRSEVWRLDIWCKLPIFLPAPIAGITLGKAPAFTGGQLPKRESIINTHGHWGTECLDPEERIQVTYPSIHYPWQEVFVEFILFPLWAYPKLLYCLGLQAQGKSDNTSRVSFWLFPFLVPSAWNLISEASKMIQMCDHVIYIANCQQCFTLRQRERKHSSVQTPTPPHKADLTDTASFTFSNKFFFFPTG